jgi:tetratricopeptide (TPR) repeat protein
MSEDRSQREQVLRERKRYGQFAIVFLFALALLHGIHSFFFTFFFWLSAGASAMALYYHIVFKRSEANTNAGNYSSREQSHQSRPTSPVTTPQSKRLVMIAIAAVVGFFFLMVVIGLIFGEESPSVEGETEMVSDSGKYQEAYDLYEQKNYRGAINILKPDLLNGVADAQSMLLAGDSYFEGKNFDSAYVWYSKVYERGVRSAALSHLIAYILDEKGNSAEAIPYYKEAIEQDSTRVDIYRRLAELEPENSNWYLEKKKQFEQ